MLAPEPRCSWEDAPRLTTRKYILLINALLIHGRTGWGTVWVEEPEERRGRREAGGVGGFRNWVDITLTCMGCQTTALLCFLFALPQLLHLLFLAHFDTPEEEHPVLTFTPAVISSSTHLCCSVLQTVCKQKLSLDDERVVELNHRGRLWPCICSSVFSGP